nr:uncharacterized protein CTRU02_15207 [Colletotrichum truncatum]KAF6781317.1 hypothetical protein CTRU02_15207 [Colletotrichum truncatum]
MLKPFSFNSFLKLVALQPLDEHTRRSLCHDTRSGSPTQP